MPLPFPIQNRVKNHSSVEIGDLNTSSIDIKVNVKDNATKMLDNRLQGNFVSKIVNLPKPNLADFEISLLFILFRLPIQCIRQTLKLN